MLLILLKLITENATKVKMKINTKHIQITKIQIMETNNVSLYLS